MRILVSGKNGQLAQALAEHSSDEFEIICLSRLQADITNYDLLDEKVRSHQPDIVINTAAFTAVDQAEISPEAAFLLNETGARNIAKICSGLKIPLIHISTDYVFDGRLSRSYRTADTPSPINVYGRSKLAGENAVREQHTEHVIIRTSWIFSPFGKNFMKTMLKLANERDTLQVVSDQFGRPTYAPHLARALLDLSRFLVQKTRGWGTYHLTNTGTFISWFDFATEIFNQASPHADKKTNIEAVTSDQFPAQAQRPVNSRLDTSLFKDQFNIELPDWKLGIADYLLRITNAADTKTTPGDKA